MERRNSFLEEWSNLVEIHGLTEQTHKHIVTTLGAFQYGQTFSIVFPLAKCSLEEYFEAKVGFFSSHVLWEQLQGVADGLSHLHGYAREDSPGSFVIAYHLDLKPTNILIIDGRLQIADFGLSRVKQINRQAGEGSTGVDNPYGYRAYAPPEHNDATSIEERSRACNRGHDIWSLGAIYSEVATFDMHGQQSLSIYRKKRVEETETSVRSLCFHINGRMKQSVKDQLDCLLKTIREHRAPERGASDLSCWQKGFYTLDFFNLIRKMLDKDSRGRGTAKDVVDSLKRGREAALLGDPTVSEVVAAPDPTEPDLYDIARLDNLDIDGASRQKAKLM